MLLIQSQRHPDFWKLPAGGIEDGEDVESAAVRETEEEAGVLGHVLGPLGLVEDLHKRSRTSYYLMRANTWLAESVYEEGRSGRGRRWFPLERAMEAVAARPHAQEALSRAVGVLRGCGGEEALLRRQMEAKRGKHSHPPAVESALRGSARALALKLSRPAGLSHVEG